MSALKDCRR